MHLYWLVSVELISHPELALKCWDLSLQDSRGSRPRVTKRQAAETAVAEWPQEDRDQVIFRRWGARIASTKCVIGIAQCLVDSLLQGDWILLAKLSFSRGRDWKEGWFFFFFFFLCYRPCLKHYQRIGSNPLRLGRIGGHGTVDNAELRGGIL